MPPGRTVRGTFASVDVGLPQACLRSLFPTGWPIPSLGFLSGLDIDKGQGVSRELGTTISCHGSAGVSLLSLPGLFGCCLSCWCGWASVAEGKWVRWRGCWPPPFLLCLWHLALPATLGPEIKGLLCSVEAVQGQKQA